MPASTFRYSAAHLLYLISLCASAVALWGWLGIPVACFVALIWAQLLWGVEREAMQAEQALAPQLIALDRPAMSAVDSSPPPALTTVSKNLWTNGLGRLKMFVVLLMGGLLIGLFLPAANNYDSMRQADISMQIVVRALAAYEDQHGAPPPAIIYDEAGRPLHSWRALLLPYLGEEKLAASYRWDEPWNGPHNSQLSEFCPWPYRIQYPQHQPARGGTSLHLLQDDDHHTFVVEHEAAWCHWLQPTALGDWESFERVPSAEHGFWKRSFFASSYRGRLAVSRQQTVVIHPPTASTSLANISPIPSQLATVEAQARCEKLEFSELGDSHLQLHYDNVLRLAVFLGAALYPLGWLTRT